MVMVLTVPSAALRQDCLPEFANACGHPDATVPIMQSLGFGTSVHAHVLVGGVVSVGSGAVIASRATIQGSSSGIPLTWRPKTVRAAIMLESAMTTEPYSGDVDELYVFGPPLTASEVADLASQVH